MERWRQAYRYHYKRDPKHALLYHARPIYDGAVMNMANSAFYWALRGTHATQCNAISVIRHEAWKMANYLLKSYELAEVAGDAAVAPYEHELESWANLQRAVFRTIVTLHWLEFERWRVKTSARIDAEEAAWKAEEERLIAAFKAGKKLVFVGDKLRVAEEVEGGS